MTSAVGQSSINWDLKTIDEKALPFLREKQGQLKLCKKLMKTSEKINLYSSAAESDRKRVRKFASECYKEN